MNSDGPTMPRFRVVPAHQRLEPGQLAVVQRHDGLVDQEEFVVCPAPVQIDFQTASGSWPVRAWKAGTPRCRRRRAPSRGAWRCWRCAASRRRSRRPGSPPRPRWRKCGICRPATSSGGSSDVQMRRTVTRASSSERTSSSSRMNSSLPRRATLGSMVGGSDFLLQGQTHCRAPSAYTRRQHGHVGISTHMSGYILWRSIVLRSILIIWESIGKIKKTMLVVYRKRTHPKTVGLIR